MASILSFNGNIISFNDNIISFSNLITSGGTIDPISLTQPIVYYQTFDTNYLSPTTPTSGTAINTLYRYNDGLYPASGDTNTIPAKWGNLNGYDMLYFNGRTVNNIKTGATYNDFIDLGFMVSTGYSFTVYMVLKPIVEYVPSFSGYGGSSIFRQSPLGPPSTVINATIMYDYLADPLSGSPSINFVTRYDGFGGDILDIDIEISPNVNVMNSKDLRVFSIRAQDTYDTVTTAAYAYVNGVETNTSTQITTPIDESISFTQPLTVGASKAFSTTTFPSYNGYFAELIIFNTMHDLPTHSGVVNFLKNRWGIA